MVEYSDPRIFGFDPKTVMTAISSLVTVCAPYLISR